MEAAVIDAQDRVEKLRHKATNSTAGHFWPPITHSKDPGKPLLLALMDRLANASATSGEVVVDRALRNRFERYGESVLGSGVQPPSINAAGNGLAEDGVWEVEQGAAGDKRAQLDSGRPHGSPPPNAGEPCGKRCTKRSSHLKRGRT